MFNRHPHAPESAGAAGRDAAPVATVTDASFGTFVTGGSTVIDFHAAWCGPCRQLAPLFDRAAAQHGERLRFGRCDVDQNPATAAQLNIMSIPTIILFDTAGREVDRIVGAPGSRRLEDFLSAAAPGAA
jgi:thioredoxin